MSQLPTESTDPGGFHKGEAESQAVPGIPIPNFDEPCTTQNVLTISKTMTTQLPVSGIIRSLPTISAQTLDDLIKMRIKHDCDEYIIIDCRFYYEFVAGHILGAINITKHQQIIDLFRKYERKKAIFIFHCEFSSNRGPTWASIFRNIDRQRNIEKWPEVTHPEVYILEGGIKDFFSKFPGECVGRYIRMEEDGTTDNSILKRCMQAFKNETSAHLGPKTPQIRTHRRAPQWPGIRTVIFSSSQPQHESHRV